MALLTGRHLDNTRDRSGESPYVALMASTERKDFMLSPALRARADKPTSYRRMRRSLSTTYSKPSQKSLRKVRVRGLRSQARKYDWRWGFSSVLSMAPYISAPWNEPHISSRGNSGPYTLSLAMTNRSN